MRLPTPEQRSEAMNHVAGAPILGGDIVKDEAQLFMVHRLPKQ
jgi:hypothetical protein